MRLRMLQTRSGAVDEHGLDIQTHERGRVYDLPPSLGDVYLREGWAELAIEPSETKPAAPKSRKRRL